MELAGFELLFSDYWYLHPNCIAFKKPKGEPEAQQLKAAAAVPGDPSSILRDYMIKGEN